MQILQDSNLDPRHPAYRRLPPLLDMRQAHNRLFEHSFSDEASPGWQAALQRYKQVMSGPYGSTDLPIKMFNDLDTLIFHGDLKHRVNMKWEACDKVGISQSFGGTLLGLTIPPTTWSVPRIRIRINIDVDWRQLPRKMLIGTVVHEMLHAYYYVHCGVAGYQDVVTERGMDISHGVFFYSAGKRIEQRWGLELFDLQGA